MESKCKSPTSGAGNTDKKTVASGKSTEVSSSPAKPHGKGVVSSVVAKEPGSGNTENKTAASGKSTEVSSSPAKPHGKGVVSSVVAKKRRGYSTALISASSSGNAMVSSANDGDVMFLRDVSVGPHQQELRFRLVHFWEARNPNSKLLIGEEMLLIDEQGTAIQGFIPAGRVDTFMPNLVAGSVYKLRNFFGSTSKKIFSVADHEVTVSFSWNSVLTVIEQSPVVFPQDRFRFHTHEEFEANCDQKGDLYDFVGHMKLISGQAITDRPIIDESSAAARRHIMVHVQHHDGPVIKLNLWDNAAAEFRQKYKSYDNTSSVILVTTVYPKSYLGTLTLASMSSSRVFLEKEVQPTREYLEWLGSNTDLANKINADVVTKPEKVTIAELFTFIKQENAKIAWFECTATIDDVFHGSPWYYISCGGCNTKATKGPTSLTCENKKCERSKVAGTPQYRTRISVYDQSEQAVFVLLGEAGRALTGMQASEIVSRYYEDNENIGADELVPLPKALLDTIGQTFNFIVKVTDHNLAGKSQSITVTKILPTEDTQSAAESEENTTTDGNVESDEVESTPTIGFGSTSAEKTRKAPASLASEDSKRPKSG